MIYETGDLVRLSVTFADLTNQPADPSTVTLAITAPDGSTQNYTTSEITRDGTGVYHFDLSTTLAGTYTYRWTGTGAVSAVQEGSVPVAASILSTARPNAGIDLCQLADVKAYIGIAPTATADDALLASLITGASQYWLTRTCRGSLSSIQNYTERYDGTGRDELLLNYFPVTAVLSLQINGNPISQSTDYFQSGWVLNAQGTGVVLLGSRWFWRGRLNILVNYQAGYSEVPLDVEEAVRKQVAVNYKRKSVTDEASIALPQGGGTTSFRSWSIPPEVEDVIERYRRLTP
jgi:hypothetical protein